MTNNKKVIGATECEADGIKFKSKWECKVYQMLKEAGLNPQYEGLKITLQEAFEPKVPFFTRIKDKRRLPGFIIQGYQKYLNFVSSEYNRFTNSVLVRL